ncbi:AGAP000232-PA-like protein [Anopheles sinensis]|uniref:AGAP000232-PA-like protein n=1 Tax=Anopheles sinensis TaxID=74873 RepID=A0A084VLN6_ANOSI|nr:AGAP000232-PA-like protein [Anopheles sinensis]
MAMEPPDVVLSPERPEPSANTSTTTSSSTAAALLQLQHRAHSAQTPPAAFHLAAGAGVQGAGGGVTSAQGASGSRSVLQPAQLTSIAVPTALLASTGHLQAASSSSTSHTPATPSSASMSNVAQPTPPIERLSRPMAFDKMESLVREMQDPETGVPVRSQKLFLTSIPSAFMGYDLIEWLMERLSIEESEALNISNQLCQHGYFFPVSDSKTLMVKDDSSLYRFQTPYYWPWQQKAPDQIEYAIYLAKRSLRNKQRHGLEDYETEALASLHKNLKGKWDFIMMQAEEQVRLAKERKKGDKIVGDSQERAYWRVHRPPPGQFTPLEPCPIPSRDRQGKPRKRTVEDWQREVDILKASLGRNRVKMSQACESLASYYETFSEYDPMMQPPLPSNPWVTEDVSFWQLNNPVVEVPTEKRVKRWGISIEEVVSDPTGLQEFTHYLKKEYSHENIRFWMAVNDLRRSSHSQITRKVKEIYEEFLEPGAPCEINIDGKTMEKVQQGLKNPSRFAFDSAAEHIYMLLLKKDCYPRFVRSEHYKSLMANAIQPSHKKRFFGFGGGAKKKGSTSAAPNPSLLTQLSTGQGAGGNVNSLSKRRGSDRSLSGSAHELAISGVKDCTKVPHSHSQSNLSDIPYSVSIYRGDMPSGVYEGACAPVRGCERVVAGGRKQEVGKALGTTLEVTLEGAVSGGGTACSVCPWETVVPDKPGTESSVSVSVCPWDDSDIKPPAKTDSKLKQFSESTHGATEITEVSERMKRSCGLRQNTLDSDFHSTKRLAPVVTEQRRASMTMAPRLSDLQFCLRANSAGDGATPPDTAGPHLSSSSSVRVSQGSLSTSFEEKEEGSESAGCQVPPCPEATIAEECPGAPGMVDAPGDPAASERHPERCRQASEEEDWKPVALGGGSNRYQDHPQRARPRAHTQSYTGGEDGGTAQVAACSATHTTMTSSGSGAPASVAVVARRPRYDSGSAGGTPRISVIYANSPERDEPNAPELEEWVQEGGQQTEPGTAASVATQTMDVGSVGGGQADMSPLNEAEDDHFFSESLRPQEPCEYDLISGDGLLPGCVAPAPTPAPSIAPLAEVEVDPPDDEPEDGEEDEPPPEREESVDVGKPQHQQQVDGQREGEVEVVEHGHDRASDAGEQPNPATTSCTAVVIIDDPGRRRKRKERTKDRPSELELIRAQKSEEENSERKGGNAVCPWDDEDESAADDAPYVKTYSTLGYL